MNLSHLFPMLTGTYCSCRNMVKANLADSLLCPKGYNIIRKDRVASTGGGVAFFVRKDIIATEVDLGCGGKNIDIACVDLFQLSVIACHLMLSPSLLL